MRLFIAIELPEVVRAGLARMQERLKRDIREGVSWVKESNLHMTMKFLGEVPDERVMSVVEALRTVPRKQALRLSIASAGAMPPRGPGRVLVADLSGDIEPLTLLAQSIDEACATAGFQKEARRFRPHITFGRLRPPRRLSPATFDEVVAARGEAFVVESFALMRSELSPKGSIYTRVAEFPLSKS